MQDTWKVDRSAPRCTACSKEFADGQDFFSALADNGQDFRRMDYCRACWDQTDRAPFFSFWKTRRRADKRPPRIDVEVVLDLFNKLAGSDRPDRVEMQFVLALYLTRRKALKLAGVRRDDEREYLRFRRPRSEEEILVENPRLDEQQIAAMNARLKDLFQAEL